MELKSDDTGDVYLDVINDSVHTFTGHTGELYAVACNPIDATLVATGGAEDKGFLWKIGDGDWKVELNGYEDSVSCLAFSADGQLLASGGVGVTVRIWDSSGHHRYTLPVFTVVFLSICLMKTFPSLVDLVDQVASKTSFWRVLLIALSRFGMLKKVSSSIHFTVMVDL
ncbi:hypothetical protein Peur_033295 [Populus x canadensis]